MAAGFALVGYILVTFKLATLWNPQAWWQSIAVWLAAAIIVHDLALFPLYAFADRLLGHRDRATTTSLPPSTPCRRRATICASRRWVPACRC